MVADRVKDWTAVGLEARRTPTDKVGTGILPVHGELGSSRYIRQAK
jgi:hypothetical protein